MITIKNVLTPNSTLCDVDISSKKRALEIIADIMHEASGKLIPERKIFDALVERERLGSTAIGSGVAIPHARITGLKEPIAVFIRIDNAISYDADDNQPVDLIFCLLVPEKANSAYLNILAQLADGFRRSNFLKRLRSASTNEELYDILVKTKHKPIKTSDQHHH